MHGGGAGAICSEWCMVGGRVGGGSGAGEHLGVSQLDQDNKSTHTYQGRSGCKSKLDSFRRLRYYTYEATNRVNQERITHLSKYISCYGN